MTMLSAVDAFFVAHQQSSGVLMQLGVEVELKGAITRDDVLRMLSHVVKCWPQLGQHLRQEWLGLSWGGKQKIGDMLCVDEKRDALIEWRNRPLNPFREPPFQLLWIAQDEVHLFAFRAHHAAVDGEAFFAVCAEALRTLAGKARATAKADKEGFIPTVKVRNAWQKVEELRKQAQSDRSARIAVRSSAPGPIAIVERDVERDRLSGWLCAGAWMKAIHGWNRSRGPTTTSLISLEVPVSLRRSRDQHLCIGNQISPLVLYGDGTQPLEYLAQQLKQQMSRAMRQRMHLALPAFSAPAKFLPWEVFRRIAASPELTGFATSHFAWFEHAQTIHDEVFSASNGALQIVDQQIYTPVCLHMGAALAILAWPERVQIFLTHRLNALSTSDANVLLDLMVQELSTQQLSRQQV
ncbi:MAG TPA: hypothetical protein VHQ64_02990, partial [Pyrinomonadaceae bacterium]|nr:hypothetical protein [Pyrinomonadaceae bacterium]